MTPIGQIFGYISVALVIVVIGLVIVVSRYKADLADALTNNTVCEMNKATMQHTLDDQNNKIEKQRIDYEERLSNIKPITRIVVKEKLQVIVTEHNATKGECDEVLSTIDAIRRAGF